MASKKQEENGSGPGTDAADLIHTILKGMTNLDQSDQQRVLSTVNAYFGHAPAHQSPAPPHSQYGDASTLVAPPAQRDATLKGMVSPEAFLEQKRPQNDVQRIVCLGYYLTFQRNQAEFKTKDLSALNNEANQPKIGNATQAAKNAYKTHLLVQAGQGQRKLSSYGRKYVEALPDQGAARALKADMPQRRRGRKAPAGRKRS